jgi:superfamily II DNA or RNA helicase
MLRIHLPPNLTAAAERDGVPLRVELDLSRAPSPEILPALALLQRWCGSGTPPQFIQLSRAQLRELAAAAGTQPVFIERGKPTAWHHDAVVAEPKSLIAHERGFQTLAASRASAAATPNSQSRIPSRSNAATPLLVDGSEHFLSLTLPSREHPRYADALALVKEQGFILEPSNRKWWLRDRHKTLNFLASQLTRLRSTFDAEFTPNFEKNTAHLRAAEIATTIAPAGDDFSVTFALQAGSADEGTLRSAVAANRGYLESDGKVFLLDAAKLEKLATAQRTLAGDPTAGVAPRRTQRISAARAAEAQEIIEELSPDFQPPEAWKTRSAALRDLTTLAPAPIPATFNVQLRPYQRLGVAWLWHLHRHRLGGILADEMGLGKTLQALGLLSAVQCSDESNESSDRQSMRRKDGAPTGQPSTLSSNDPKTHRTKPSLVVAPASLLENWRREAVRFAPQLRVFVHHGERRLSSVTEFSAHDLIITSYGTLARDQTLFTEVEFAVIIADEAQHIKNRRSQNAAALRALRAHARFLLTGTPLENSLDDLRSLFEFLLPGYLTRVPAGLRGEERAWFDDRLRAQTAPYILRRTKQAVAPELPEKLEHVIWCELTPSQARLYRETQERSERELFDLEAGGASESKLQFAALTQLLRLRQICCDPRLVNVAQLGVQSSQSGDSHPAQDAKSETKNDSLSETPSAKAQTSNQAGFAGSAKLDAFNELLAEAVDDGHRVLVFSQFTSLLALLRAELDAQQLAHCYLDGSMPTRARQAEVDRFQASADIPLFLLSLKAGGTGLNLTGADTVVHFDPWWNPAAEAQATDRAHRIGQTRVVTSYKLIAAGTVEEKVLALQAEKRALLAGIFEASDAAAAKLSLADLKSLLK